MKEDGCDEGGRVLGRRTGARTRRIEFQQLCRHRVHSYKHGSLYRASHVHSVYWRRESV